MENFDWTSFTKRIAVKSSIAEIYNAWTKANELEKWFLKKVNFYSLDKTAFNEEANVIKNIRYEWYWYSYDEPMKGRITSVNGKDFIQFTFEGECLVDVNLQEMGEYVVVTLRQHKIPLDNKSKQYIRLGCSNGWTFYLTNLKSVYEGGLDLRNKEEKLPAMINN